MNRSLLLVICDFLLLSLLALARFDEPEDQTAPKAEQAIEQDAAANQDLIDVLKMSLDAEQENRDELSTELKETQEELEARAKALAEREAKLEETQNTAEQLAAEKARLEQQREQLTQAKAQAEAERARLAEQSEAARQKLEEAERDRVALAKSLAEVKETAATSTERLRAMQNELAEKARLAEQLAAEREQLESQVRTAEMQRQTLATQLEVSRTEARTRAEQLEVAQRNIELTSQEKARMQETTQALAQNVGQMAESTDQIREEVKRAQPLSLNTIFDRYQKNKVRISFSSTEPGLFGSTTEQYSFDTVLVRDGSSVYALLPLNKTPFKNASLEGAQGYIQYGSRKGRFDAIGALTADPRILALRLPENFPQSWGVQAFNLAKEPLKFPKAVLVSDQGRYGEVGFKIVPRRPEYLDMDSSIFNDLFGEFSPREGDLVFSQTGDLIGVMVNGEFAVIAPSANVSTRLSLGDQFNRSEVNIYQSRLRANSSLLPPELR